MGRRGRRRHHVFRGLLAFCGVCRNAALCRLGLSLRKCLRRLRFLVAARPGRGRVSRAGMHERLATYAHAYRSGGRVERAVADGRLQRAHRRGGSGLDVDRCRHRRRHEEELPAAASDSVRAVVVRGPWQRVMEPLYSRVAMLVAPKRIELREEAVPLPPPGGITVRIRAALTDGTDLKTYRRGHPKMPMPTRFGHEFSGDVFEIADDVTGFACGDAVMCAHTAPCGKCFWCRRDQPELCES